MSMSMSAVGAEAAPLNAMIWGWMDESKVQNGSQLTVRMELTNEGIVLSNAR